jgi:outer membrane protein assembly factor BamB
MRFLPVLGLAVVLSACSGGGGSSGPPIVPALPWGGLRHDITNSGVGEAIDRNGGKAALLAAIPGGVTASTPAIDRSGNIYIGTGNGVVSFARDGTARWTFSECVLACPSNPPLPCTPCPDDGSASCLTVPVGAVSSSPTVTAGNTVVVSSEGTGTVAGAVFAVQQFGTRIDCQWYFQPPSGPGGALLSSPATLVDAFDRSLISVFFGGPDGVLRALNPDGTVRWSIVAASAATTSTPALDGLGGSYITTPDGNLVTVDNAGRPSWRASPPPGVPPAQEFLPSPAVGANAYVVGADGTLFSFNFTTGARNWQFPPSNPLVGSPAFLTLSFDFQSSTTIDTIVYGVDSAGTVYAVRDSTGAIVQPQRCAGDLTRDCRIDSCVVAGAGTCLSTNRCSISGTSCTRDSCSNVGPCMTIVPYGPDSSVTGVSVPGQITTSPIVSADTFVVAGTVNGDVCARALNGFVPGQDLDNPTAAWATGCVTVDDKPTVSSPVIGNDGDIFVTTDAGLFVIE